jgi:diadenylate cyclase
MIGISRFRALLNEYTNNFSTQGILRLSIDVLLTFFIFFTIYKLLKIKFHHKKVYLFLLIAGVIYAIINIMQFTITIKMFNFFLFWSFGILIIVYGQDIKHLIENAFHSTRNENMFSTEEEKHQVIEILIRSATYLSKRKVGALITIEREDNLNSFIEKAILIKGTLSEELLTTIFFVGTATHDGAVIIRKNKIMCAGAYLPSTDKYDVPKSLGTRHRAAIGLSERYDSITIVVSEETGNISVTADGVIDIGLTEEKFREILERYLIVK